MNDKQLVDNIVAFISFCGIEVCFETISEQTFLPGMTIRRGTLVIDTDKLKYPGDLLHEAGHIAVVPAAVRKNLSDNINDTVLADGSSLADGATEMAAIAWSYAACRHLEIDPLVVFHENGYKGGAAEIAHNFNQGRYFGVPLLNWYGMTNYTSNSPVSLTDGYPKMINWLSQQ